MHLVLMTLILSCSRSCMTSLPLFWRQFSMPLRWIMLFPKVENLQISHLYLKRETIINHATTDQSQLPVSLKYLSISLIASNIMKCFEVMVYFITYSMAFNSICLMKHSWSYFFTNKLLIIIRGYRQILLPWTLLRHLIQSPTRGYISWIGMGYGVMYIIGWLIS